MNAILRAAGLPARSIAIRRACASPVKAPSICSCISCRRKPVESFQSWWTGSRVPAVSRTWIPESGDTCGGRPGASPGTWYRPAASPGPLARELGALLGQQGYATSSVQDQRNRERQARCQRRHQVGAPPRGSYGERYHVPGDAPGLPPQVSQIPGSTSAHRRHS